MTFLLPLVIFSPFALFALFDASHLPPSGHLAV
jgi:hypothetical protein